MALMSVMLDTFHVLIGPCKMCEQFGSWEILLYAVTAFLSSALDCGENNNLAAQKFAEMDTTKAKKITYDKAWAQMSLYHGMFESGYGLRRSVCFCEYILQGMTHPCA